MNEKRSWPGMPNRYSTILAPRVIRPKSRATVVVVLRPTPVRSSRPMLAVVRASSVCSGRTSLIAPTRVVLPAPNPPAMRILCAVKAGTVAAVPPGLSERAESMKYLLEHVVAGFLVSRSFPYDRDRPELGQIADQHAHHPERQRGVGGEVREGDLPPAQVQQPVMLGSQPRGVVGRERPPGGDEQGEERERIAFGGLGPAAGHRVRPHHRARFPLRPAVVRGHLGHSSGNSEGDVRGSAARGGLACLASIAIS